MTTHELIAMAERSIAQKAEYGFETPAMMVVTVSGYRRESKFVRVFPGLTGQWLGHIPGQNRTAVSLDCEKALKILRKSDAEPGSKTS